MKLYKISRTKWGYDDFDSAVVAAKSEHDARMTHPNGDLGWDGKSDEDWKWYGWCYVEDVFVEEIGTTKLKAGVVVSSFNAG